MFLGTQHTTVSALEADGSPTEQVSTNEFSSLVSDKQKKTDIKHTLMNKHVLDIHMHAQGRIRKYLCAGSPAEHVSTNELLYVNAPNNRAAAY